MTFFRIKQAMIFAINPPPIPELAAVGGFDFRLQDRGGIGREKLLEARNMALGMASQNPALVGVRPEGQEAGAAAAARHRPRQGRDPGRVHRRPERHAAIGAGRGLHQRLRAPGPHPARADAGRGRYAQEREDILRLAGAQQQGRHGAAVGTGHAALGGRLAQAGPLQRPAVDEDRRQSGARPQHRRSDGGDGRDRRRSCRPASASNGRRTSFEERHVRRRRRRCCSASR